MSIRNRWTFAEIITTNPPKHAGSGMTHWRARKPPLLVSDPIFFSYWVGFATGAIVMFGVLCL